MIKNIMHLQIEPSTLFRGPSHVSSAFVQLRV